MKKPSGNFHQLTTVNPSGSRALVNDSPSVENMIEDDTSRVSSC